MSILNTIAAIILIIYGFVGIVTTYEYLRVRTKQIKGAATITFPATYTVTKHDDGTIILEPQQEACP